MFVQLRISPARIKVAALNFALTVDGVLGRGSPIFGNFAPQNPQIGRIGARRMDVGSACVDNRQSPSLTVLVFIIICVMCRYRSSINVMVLTLLEKEELQKLQNKWWYDKGQCVVESDNKVSV